MDRLVYPHCKAPGADRRNREKFTLECEFLAKEKRVVRLKSPREVERFVSAA